MSISMKSDVKITFHASMDIKKDLESMKGFIERLGALAREGHKICEIIATDKSLQYRVMLVDPEPAQEFSDGTRMTPELREKLNTSVKELGLSVRAYNGIWNRKIKTLRELVQKSETEMLGPNFGKKTLNEVKDVLAGMGLSLGMKFPPESK